MNRTALAASKGNLRKDTEARDGHRPGPDLENRTAQHASRPKSMKWFLAAAAVFFGSFAVFLALPSPVLIQVRDVMENSLDRLPLTAADHESDGGAIRFNGLMLSGRFS